MAQAHLPIVTPIVHPNGDRRETLLDNLETLYKALQAADLALAVCSSNSRNFYPEPGRWERYQTQHTERQHHLRALMDSVVAEAEQIDEERH